MYEAFKRSPGENQSLHLPIDPHRRLVSERMAGQDAIAEYFDMVLQSRIITIPQANPQADLHAQLGEKRLPVFSSMHLDDETVRLIVPPGSRTLRQSLNLLARDVENYQDVFNQLGGMLHDLRTAGFGLPVTTSKRQILDAVAFSPEQDDVYGTRLYFIPPYNLDASVDTQEVNATVRNELRYSGHFTSEAISHLMQAMEDGGEQ